MVWLDRGLFAHSPTEGRLGRFQVLPSMNKAAINIHMRLLCGQKFSTHWMNTKECSEWIIWEVCV